MNSLKLKQSIKKILTSRISTHVYIWLFFFFLFAFTSSPKDGAISLGARITTGLTFIGAAIFPVYTHFFIFEKFFYKKKYLIYILLLLPTVFGFSYLSFLLLNYQEKNPSYFMNIFLTVIMILVATSLKVLKDNVSQRFLLQEIKAKQVQNELDLLKAQINPHFLFNTLNNLYGLARKKDQSAADGIAQLSHLMRYMIYDSMVNQISLKKEIQQIERLIKLQKLRFSKEDEVLIEFKKESKITGIQIPPMLLIPFVENAFKHGISLKSPSYIRILLRSIGKDLHFTVKNSLHKQRRSNGNNSGVGLHNVKRRLELLFPGQHDLTVKRSEKEFHVGLIIKNISGSQA